MKVLIAIGFLIGISVSTQAAEITDSAWVGQSELYIDGKLQCSADLAKQPAWRPAGHGLHALTIHEGGSGWVWPSITGGCNGGHLGSGLQLQVKGTDLFDSSGRKVGAISENAISATNYSDPKNSITIESFNFRMFSSEQSQIEVKFRWKKHKGLFSYVASYHRYRDSNWP